MDKSSAHSQGRRLRPKSRRYNTRRIKRDLSYGVWEIAELFDLHPNAVRRWIRCGLVKIDDHRPIYIHGSDLIAFLNTRQTARKRPCRADEFYCCRCRGPRHPAGGRVTVVAGGRTKLLLSALCEDCSARMNRAGSVQRLSDYARTFVIAAMPQTGLEAHAEASVMSHLERNIVDVHLQPRQ